MFYTYILYSENTDKFYIGYTQNIETRLQKHNAGSTPSTRAGRPWKMLYFESFDTKTEAILREREIKAKKSRKYIEELIARR